MARPISDHIILSDFDLEFPGLKYWLWKLGLRLFGRGGGYNDSNTSQEVGSLGCAK